MSEPIKDYGPIKSPKQMESSSGVPDKVSKTLPKGAAKAK